MIGTRIKLAVGIGFLAVAVLGLGLGRMSAGSGDTGDRKPAPARTGKATVSTAPVAANKVDDNDEADVEAAVEGAGNELVVRRPFGSYTREVAPYGKITLTFTESRIHLVANARIEDLAFTLEADADYSMNRESMVYGIITAMEVSGLPADAAAEVAFYASAANDMPFAFRLRADDDAVTVKDIRFGALGSPAFTKIVGDVFGDSEAAMAIIGVMSGKFKADPNPDRRPPPDQPRRSRR